MEGATMKYSSGDYKHRMSNPKRNFSGSYNNHSLFSYPSDNLLFASFLANGHLAGGGLLSTPPSSLYCSYPPVFNHQQPPLLPLPLINHQNMILARTNSNFNADNTNIRVASTRINKNVKNRGRDQSLTPKKSKSQKKDLKKEEPEPKDVAKDVISKVLNESVNDIFDDVDKFSVSVVFSPSPPPSSLPLPTFSILPKMSCHAEMAAVGRVDAGATDSLRRLLRLP